MLQKWNEKIEFMRTLKEYIFLTRWFLNIETHNVYVENFMNTNADHIRRNFITLFDHDCIIIYSVCM